MIAGGIASAFATEAAVAFRSTAGTSVVQCVYCRLADGVVCLELARPGLLPLSRALAHLSCEPTTPDLTIRVFDRTPLPRPPWDWSRLESRGVVATADPAWCISYQDDVLSVWRRDAPDAVAWLRDADRMTLTQRGSPFLHLLHAWARSRGWALLHAAAVAGVLLVGPGGAGKSSCALASARAGLPYLADDYCLARGDELESLYCSAKLLEKDLSGTAAFREPGGKVLVWMDPVRRARLRAIVVPDRTGEAHASLEPISPARALLALAPSTLYQLPWSGPDSVAALSDLVRRAPCYRLRLGARQDVPRLLQTLA